MLSTSGIWKTPLKNDQASYQRNADGSLKVSGTTVRVGAVLQGCQCRCSLHRFPQGIPA